MNGLPGGILFLALFLTILIPLSYCLRTNGDIKDIYNGFYALEKFYKRCKKTLRMFVS